MITTVVQDRDIAEVNEGKTAEKEDLWGSNVSDVQSNAALDDNKIPPIGKNSLGQDEPLQFELDNRSPPLTSFKVATSQSSQHDTLPPSQIDVHDKVNDSHLMRTIPNSKEISDKSDRMNDAPEFLKLECNTSSRTQISSFQSSGASPSKQNHMNTPPPNLFFPDQINIKSNDVSHSKSPIHQKTQSKARRSGRVVRPFVYSAIGSLECVNQNSLGSFNHKLCLASKAKIKFDGREKSRVAQYSKKTLRESNLGHNLSDTSMLDGIHGTQTRSSSTKASTINTQQTQHAHKTNTANICSDVQNDEEDKEIKASCESKPLQPGAKITIPSYQQSKYGDNGIGKANDELKGKKRVTIDAKTKKIRPVELFRPSCDAYTPRMGRKEIKYKPAKERASMGDMSTTMGTIQRPNFQDALRRVAIIIQQHIVKIERRFAVGVPGLDNAGLFTPAMRDAFAEENFVTPRYKCNMVNIPMARPGVIYGMRKIRTKYNIPTASDIYEFAHQLFNSVQLSSECSIICLIYVERLMEVAKVPVMANTWRPIFMCGLLLASKVWQDWSSWNIEFASVYPQFTLDSINRLELQFLKMAKWDLYISSSLYAKYYFMLRSLLEKHNFRHRYNRMVGVVDNRASLQAIKVSKRSEMVKEQALSHLSMSM